MQKELSQNKNLKCTIDDSTNQNRMLQMRSRFANYNVGSAGGLLLPIRIFVQQFQERFLKFQ